MDKMREALSKILHVANKSTAYDDDGMCADGLYELLESIQNTAEAAILWLPQDEAEHMETCKCCQAFLKLEADFSAYKKQSLPSERSGDVEKLLHIANDCQSLIEAGLQRDALYSIAELKRMIAAMGPERGLPSEVVDFLKRYANSNAQWFQKGEGLRPMPDKSEAERILAALNTHGRE